MDDNLEKDLQEYKVEIVLLFVLLICIIITIVVVKDLIYIKFGYDYDGRIEQNIKRKGRLVSLLILIVALYFLYTTYKSYLKNKTRSNYYFLIIAILVAIAAIIRYFNLSKKETVIEGAQDIIF